MREEANPRKIQRRAHDYGASPAPITVSHSGLLSSAFPTVSCSRKFRALESSKSATQQTRLIATRQLLETPVTHSKQTTATRSNRYFFGRFPSSLSQPLALAKGRFPSQSFQPPLRGPNSNVHDYL
jgi:hypothetical protein